MEVEVAKTRYLYQENNINYEIDVFTGSLTGLVLIDVEFATPDKLRAINHVYQLC